MDHEILYSKGSWCNQKNSFRFVKFSQFYLSSPSFNFISLNLKNNETLYWNTIRDQWLGSATLTLSSLIDVFSLIAWMDSSIIRRYVKGESSIAGFGGRIWVESLRNLPIFCFFHAFVINCRNFRASNFLKSQSRSPSFCTCSGYV